MCISFDSTDIKILIPNHHHRIHRKYRVYPLVPNIDLDQWSKVHQLLVYLCLFHRVISNFTVMCAIIDSNQPLKHSRFVFAH